jgi:hypothetical protein
VTYAAAVSVTPPGPVRTLKRPRDENEPPEGVVRPDQVSRPRLAEPINMHQPFTLITAPMIEVLLALDTDPMDA